MTRNLSFFALLICLCIGIDAHSQTRHRVNNSGLVAPFTDLALAIAAAAPGDTIVVENSDISYGDVAVNKKLVIYGTGYFLADNDSTHADLRKSIIDTLTIESGTNGVIVSGFTMNAAVLNGDKCTLERCHILGDVVIGTVGAPSQVQVKKNFIESTSPVIMRMIDGIGANISNNLFKSTSGLITDFMIKVVNGTGVVVNNVFFGAPRLELKNMTVQNNYFHDAAINTVTSSNLIVDHNAANTGFMSFYPSPTNQDLSLAPFAASMPDTLFSFNLTTSRDGRYELNPWPTNVLKGAGTGGNDIGIFGGVGPYIKSGMPPIPSIFLYSGGTTGTTTSGLQVTVKVKSHK